jgi:hypothetical protein
MKARVVSAVGVALLCGACGEGGQTETPPPQPEPADRDNATFESADPIEVDSKGIFEMVDGREDVDFFSFEGRQGEWVEIRSNYFDPFTFSDTRLTLFDERHVQLAFNRYVESLRGEKVLARIVTRLPETGKYFVQVGDPEGPPYSAGLSQAYLLTVTELASSEGYSVEGDGDLPTPVVFHERIIETLVIDESFLVGTFTEPSDVDRFSFTVPAGVLQNLSAEVLESGDLADGSTTPAGSVWVTDESGTNVVARIDNAQGQSFLAPPLEPGNYVLQVAHPETPKGANDFYVIRTLLGPENPIEAADSTNGTIATAEPLTVTLEYGNNAAFLLTHVGSDDIDYFRFDGSPGHKASTYCDAAVVGSGLVGLHVSVRDESDAVLLESNETRTSETAPGTSVSLENVTIPASGSLYVRTTKDGQLPDVAGDWARCAIYEQ